MSLPPIMNCCSFEKTVLPYLPQLYVLPGQTLESLKNPTHLKNLYLQTNPLVTPLAFSLVLAPLFLLISEINHNNSQIDRFWSILPSVYNTHFVIYAHLSGIESNRLYLVLTLSVLWSLRLTFNYFRKGGYQIGSEDYRWKILRNQMSSPLFLIFNIVFTSLAQNILLFLITTPTYLILLNAQTSNTISTADVVFACILFALIIFESIADEQQWNYQEAKKKYIQTAKISVQYKQEELERGFLTTGLWSFSRHPNFAAEQAIWIFFYLWACWTINTLFNWSGTGSLSYVLLFQGSTWFTEHLSARKYRHYKEYQTKVGKFIPQLSSRPLNLNN